MVQCDSGITEWGRGPGIVVKGLVSGGEAREMVSWLGHARKYLLAGTKKGVKVENWLDNTLCLECCNELISARDNRDKMLNIGNTGHPPP